jgi:sporulation protein YlmC with PRC-barrel domain
MNRFAKELVGRKVILRHEGFMAGEVEEVIINPENGDFLGFVVGQKGNKNKKALPEKDIMGINNQFILVKSAEKLGDLDDVVRIKAIRDQKISIEKNRVYTISNMYLGRVSDYTIDLALGKLSRLYLKSWAIKKMVNHNIIESKHIVSIKKNRITVDDAVVKQERKVRAVGQKEKATN